MEYHPHVHYAHRTIQRRYGKTRAGTIAQFARVYGDRLVPEAAREQFMTMSVHLNPRSSVGTRVAFNQKADQWYEELCDTLGVDALEWRGQPIHTVQPLTRLATLQPIRPRPAYQPEDGQAIGQQTATPYRAPAACQPGTFRRRQERYRKLAHTIGERLTQTLADEDDQGIVSWTNVKSQLRDAAWMQSLVRRAADTPNLHQHLTQRTVDAAKRAVAKEKRNIQRLLVLRHRARQLTERQHVGSSRASDTSLDDGLSDEEDEAGTGAPIKNNNNNYGLDEAAKLELDTLPARIERALADHLLYHEGDLRQSYSFLPLSSSDSNTRRQRTRAVVQDDAATATMPSMGSTRALIHGRPTTNAAHRYDSNAMEEEEDDDDDEPMPDLRPYVQSVYDGALAVAEGATEEIIVYDDIGDDEDADADPTPNPRPLVPVGDAYSDSEESVMSEDEWDSDDDDDDERYALRPIASQQQARRAPAAVPMTPAATKAADAFPGTAVLKRVSEMLVEERVAPTVAIRQQQPARVAPTVRFAPKATLIEAGVDKPAPKATPIEAGVDKPVTVTTPNVVPQQQAATEDSSVFFEEHAFSKEIFAHAKNQHTNGMRKLAASYEESPVHIALKHYNTFGRRSKNELVRSANIDGGEQLLTHVATLHVPSKQCRNAPAFQHPEFPGYVFHAADAVFEHPQ